MEILEVVGLAGAAFAAGAINAVAGGGSLVSFPALIAAGYTSKVANVTNTVALWPGYFAGSVGYRSELSVQRQRVKALVLPSVLGAVAGSAILLSTPAKAFETIVPFLILFASALMAFQDQIAAFMRARGHDPGPGAERSPLLAGSTFVLAVYGAYFGAGLGILLMAALGILLPDEAQRSNALKGILSMIMNAVAVVYFAAFGPVEWLPAGVMAVGATAGGFLGVGVARRLGKRWLRVAVVVYGVAAAVVIFLK